MFDITIIGGGIVGFATAYQIKTEQPKLKVCLIEKESAPAMHQTGNNSGVIHSGVYYKPGSLKASNCINGYNRLLDFCREEEIAFDLCGKVIVATDEQELPALDKILERGQQNGLSGLKKLGLEEVKEIEPYVNGIAGIWVPQTGIIDYTAVTLKYEEKFKKFEGQVFYNTTALSVENKGSMSIVKSNKQDFETKLVVNCAGLYSDKVARMTHPELNLKIVPFRGEYYKLRQEKEYLVKNLIYPVPDPAFPFLGVHFTRMINGGVEAGPNAVLAFAREGYKKTDISLSELSETLCWKGFRKVASKYWQTGMGELYRSFSKKAFTKALQKLIPEIQEQDLVDGGAGVRAQACDKEGGLIDDFMIIEGEGYINVCNAPSPAATSSLTIARTISKIVADKL